MNRLTRVEGLSTLIKDGWKKKDTEKNYTSICYGCEEIRKCVNKCGFCKALDKLVAYEDTGLEPEQVKQLNDAFTNSQKKLEKAFDDLLEYKKLEEQGLLHIAKIPDGTEIYIIINEIDRMTNDVYGDDIIKDTYQYGHTECWCGKMNKDWFLTLEEAEKALEVE